MRRSKACRGSDRYELKRKDIIQGYESYTHFQGMSGGKSCRVAYRKQNSTLDIERNVDPDGRISFTHCVLPREESESNGDRHPKQIELAIYDIRPNG